VVIDSVAALVPKAEIEGDMGDRQVGAQARLMSQALRKLTGAINKSKTAVLFVNQTRMKIGVMFGNPETTSGGVALKFYSTIRINIRKGATIKVKDDPIGSKTYVQVVKNKLAPPFKKTEFDIIYGKGISLMGEVIDMGVDLKIVGKKGTWYNYGDIKLGQGRENSRDFLEENDDIANEIMTKIKKEIGLLPPDEEKPEAESKKEE
ncbi:MAG: recombinase RecA, partial [bacterium]